MTKEILSVQGMSCSHCEGRVNTALGGLNGIKTVKASAKKNEVLVKFDETAINLDEIKKTIKDTGYEV